MTDAQKPLPGPQPQAANHAPAGIVTTNQVHQDMLAQIQTQLKDATGQTYPVEPITPDSTMDIENQELNEGDSLSQFYERAILAKPGVEPSKSFLSKLLNRLKKKNPDTA